MLESEAQQVLERISDLWPSWGNKRSDAETYKWVSMLKRYPRQQADAAVDEMWETSTFAIPKPGHFRKAISQRVTSTLGAGVMCAPVCTDTFYYCVTPPAERPHWEGNFCQMVYPNKDMVPMKGEILSDARLAARKAEELYGGQWDAVQGVSVVEMQDRWRNARAVYDKAAAEAKKKDDFKKAEAKKLLADQMSSLKATVEKMRPAKATDPGYQQTEYDEELGYEVPF